MNSIICSIGTAIVRCGSTVVNDDDSNTVNSCVGLAPAHLVPVTGQLSHPLTELLAPRSTAAAPEKLSSSRRRGSASCAQHGVLLFNYFFQFYWSFQIPFFGNWKIPSIKTFNWPMYYKLDVYYVLHSTLPFLHVCQNNHFPTTVYTSLINANTNTMLLLLR